MKKGKKEKQVIIEEIVKWLFPEFFRENLTNYLSRDDRILSLAKEHYAHFKKTLQLGELERKIFEKPYKSIECFIKDTSKAARTYLSKGEYEALSNEIDLITSPLDLHMKFEEIESKDCPNFQIVYRVRKSGGKLLRVSIIENDDVYSFYSSTKKLSNQLCFTNSVDFIADACETIAHLLVFAYCYKAIVNGKCDDIIGVLDEKYHGSREMTVADFNKEHFEYLKSKGLNLKTNRHYISASFYMLPYAKEHPLSYKDLRSCSAKKNNQHYYWPHMNEANVIICDFDRFLPRVYEEKEKMVKALNHMAALEKEISGDRAAVYQLKKNIPQKTLDSMKASMLNDYFGFVEYDEDVDLQKILEIEKEFMAVHETYLSAISDKGEAIRFRKLGNYKASGLYFPFLGCLCVDYRYPDSFIHEYGHLIDYRNGDNLSLEPAFSDILRDYEEHLRKAMSEDTKFSEKMNKKSKYSLSYYLTPTEVFARSFELFVSKCLKVKNSLLPVEFDQNVYPQSEEYLNKINNYFKELLCIQTEEFL